MSGPASAAPALEAPASAAPAVDVHGLTVRYGAHEALRDVTLRVPHGTVCGIVGVNGSGKSTLFKALTGEVRPSAGRVEIADLARDRSAVASMPQAEAIDEAFPISVREVVAMGRYGRLGPLRRLRAHDRTLVERAIADCGLTELADRPIGALSGGQRKRAFVARALAQEASVLLLDEPFGGVDEATQRELSRILVERARAGACVLVSLHDLERTRSLCDEVVLLQGEVVAHGRPERVLTPELLARAFSGAAS